jgi:hypothetical protein
VPKFPKCSLPYLYFDIHFPLFLYAKESIQVWGSVIFCKLFPVRGMLVLPTPQARGPLLLAVRDCLFSVFIYFNCSSLIAVWNCSFTLKVLPTETYLTDNIISTGWRWWIFTCSSISTFWYGRIRFSWFGFRWTCGRQSCQISVSLSTKQHTTQ